MLRSRWHPLEDVRTLRQKVSQRMEEGPFPSRLTRMVRPEERPMRLPLDGYTTGDEIVIKATLPGLDTDDVTITLQGDKLTISGEIPAPLENVTYLFQERPYGPFSRSLTLHVPVEVDHIEARFEKGVLTVILPKASEPQPSLIEVRPETPSSGM